MPSTPAVRAPLFPRTLCQATTRKAGSQTRLNTSSNRRWPSANAHWFSFFCRPSTRASASLRLGHGAPIFISDLLVLHWAADPAGSLRHVDGFPVPGLLRILRPTPAASAGDGRSHLSSQRDGREGPPEWFPRSPWQRSTGLVPSYAPAASPWIRRRLSPWPPSRRHQPRAEFSPPKRGCAPQPSPYPPGWSWWFSLEGLSSAGSSRTPSCVACRTRTIWQCWCVPALSGLLSALTPVPEIGLPSASSTCCDRPMAVSFHHRTLPWRLVALNISSPDLVHCFDFIELHQAQKVL